MGRLLLFIQRMIKDYTFRTTVFSGMTFTINFFYAAWLAILAGYYGSLWYGTLSTYYFSLCLVRGFTLNFERLSYRGSGMAKFRQSLKYYLFSGIMMFLLNVVFAVMAWFIIGTEQYSYNSSTVPVIVSAAYALYKFFIAIYNAIKAKKYDDYMVRALRNINLIDAIISAFAMVATMLNNYGGGVHGALFPIALLSGIAAGVVSLIICVYMVVVSSTKLKKLPAADAPDDI